MGLTDGQQRCVDTLDQPLVVAAGAGSGKTFTLTERIVGAFDKGFVTDIGQVCAITFTKKAAGELKSRIKSRLRSSGRPEQALKVDDAWISTIHGMCSRILRAHAVELGIDPAFSVVQGADADALLAQAVETVLVQARASSESESIDALFDLWPARSAGFASSSVESMLTALVEQGSAAEKGADAFVLPDASMAPAAAVARVLDVVEELVAMADAGKPSESSRKWIADASEQVERARAALEQGVDDCEQALRLIAPFKLAKNFGSKDYKAMVAEGKLTVNTCVMEMRLGAAQPHARTLVDLARRALDEFAALKHAHGMLDNNDLLVMAAHALEDHPSIAARYADKFRLIMVDEFQDTDQMQVDMIKRLAGEGAVRLCTVGDAQQSIYRFRGADVGVYRRHLASVRAGWPTGVIELSDNFRSHADVLSFVECVFTRPDMFGGDFMPLAAKRDVKKEDTRYGADESRISVLHTSYPARGVGKDQARERSAQRIAQAFAGYRQAGHAAGEMVVLLGSMTHADVYAKALRESGFACVVSGGSVFSRTAEAQLVLELVRVIANPYETEALFNVLTSELFAFDASCLLAVGGPKGFWSMVRACGCGGAAEGAGDHAREAAGLSTAQPSRVACALRVMGAMREQASIEPVSRVVEQVVRDSGWLTRLERKGAEGLASAGNVYKAIRMIRDVEHAGALGPASVKCRFEETLASSKEAPGALSVTGGDSVRILTVHASKGLEFPIVAVAEFSDNTGRGGDLLTCSIGGNVYLSLDLPSRALKKIGDNVSSADKRELSAAMFELAEGDDELTADVETSAGALHRRFAIERYDTQGDVEEDKRLLYVALTRAREALVVASVGATSKADPFGKPKSALAGVLAALDASGEGGSFGRTMCDFGGFNPAVVECEALSPDEGDEDGDAQEASPEEKPVSFAVPAALPAEELPPRETCRCAHEGVFSYSSVSDASHEGDLLDRLARAYAVDVSGADNDSSALSLPVSEHDEHRDLSFAVGFEGDLPDLDASALFDQDRATRLGTAFHRLAQYAVVARTDARLQMPPDSRIEALARTCRLDQEQRTRLAAALDLWFGCSVAHEMQALPYLSAEVPFFVAAGDEAFLEGEIDLLGFDEERTHALVVDYKTGGSDDESAEHLRRKHVLQAACYAYAILLQGAQSVDATFVRVERRSVDDPAEPQCVRYRFEADDLPSLAQMVATLAP